LRDKHVAPSRGAALRRKGYEMLTQDLCTETWPSDSITPKTRQACAAAACAQAMNPLKRLRKKFHALRDDEDRIVREGVPRDCCNAYVSYRESGEINCWVESFATEGQRAEFKLLATKAGIALGAPYGTSPREYFLKCLFVDGRANKSEYIHVYSDEVATIERVFDASATFCARLECQSLEKSVMPSENAAEGVAARRPRRGYRTEVRQWMVHQGIPTLAAAAKRLGMSLSALKSIMSERGKPRYGDAALTRILGSIGYKGE